jgi:hypothetical protein
MARGSLLSFLLTSPDTAHGAVVEVVVEVVEVVVSAAVVAGRIVVVTGTVVLSTGPVVPLVALSLEQAAKRRRATASRWILIRPGCTTGHHLGRD